MNFFDSLPDVFYVRLFSKRLLFLNRYCEQKVTEVG